MLNIIKYLIILSVLFLTNCDDKINTTKIDFTVTIVNNSSDRYRFNCETKNYRPSSGYLSLDKEIVKILNPGETTTFNDVNSNIDEYDEVTRLIVRAEEFNSNEINYLNIHNEISCDIFNNDQVVISIDPHPTVQYSDKLSISGESGCSNNNNIPQKDWTSQEYNNYFWSGEWKWEGAEEYIEIENPYNSTILFLPNKSSGRLKEIYDDGYITDKILCKDITYQSGNIFNAKIFIANRDANGNVLNAGFNDGTIEIIENEENKKKILTRVQSPWEQIIELQPFIKQ